MQSFEYVAPASINEAVGLLGDDDVALLAGGTDLLVQLRRRVREASRVVDIKAIPELKQVELSEDGLTLGAAVCCWDLAKHDDVREVYPGLVEAAELIGSMQIQGRASVGGNLCNGSPAADTTPALIALAARASVVGRGGSREIPVESFVTSPGQTALANDEILVSLKIPRPAPGSSDAYLRFIPRSEMDIAVAGSGVSVTLDGDGVCTAARVSLGAVAPTPLLVEAAAAALVGSRVDEAALQAAGEHARAATNPISDMRGPADYRRRLAAVLTRRAGAIAAERARNQS